MKKLAALYTLLSLSLFAILFCQDSSFADPLEQSLVERVGFDPGDLEGRSIDGRGFDVITPFAPYTDGKYYSIADITAHPIGSALTMRYIAGITGFRYNEFGVVVRGTFRPIVRGSAALGTQLSLQLSPGDIGRLAIHSPAGLYTARDLDNPPSENTGNPYDRIHVLAQRIVRAGTVTITKANLVPQSFTVAVAPGDVVIFFEDYPTPGSDMDWNDGVIIAQQRPRADRYAIAGAVRFADGAPVAAVKVHAGSERYASETTEDGKYKIPLVPNGKYEMKGIRDGYVIKPANFDNPVVVEWADREEIDFVADCARGYERKGNQCVHYYAISGAVRFADGSPVVGVNVQSNEDSDQSSVTGNYRLNGHLNGSYQVTASKPGFLVQPSNFTNPVVVNGADRTNIDFVATCEAGYRRQGSECLATHSISGATRFEDGTPLSGVNITVGSVTTLTLAGSYAVDGLVDGDYAVDASLSGYVLVAQFGNPVTVHGSNVTDRDFVVSCSAGYARIGSQCLPTYTISGTVRFEDGTPVAGAAMSGVGASTTSNGGGAYQFLHVIDGSYSLSGAKSGMTIEPLNFTNPLVVAGANLENRDFVARCAEGFVRNGANCEQSPTETVTISATDGTILDYVGVSWVKSSGLGACTLSRAQFANEPGTVLASGLTTTTYEDRSAVPGVVYYYHVECLVNATTVTATSNVDPGSRPSAEADCDGDGVSDAQEILDGTAVCDPGSFQTRLKSPVFTKYNTFLSQWNFLELISSGTAAVQATVSIYTINGELVRAVPLTIQPGTQQDLDIHSIVNHRDTYGLVRIDFNDRTPGANLLGRMSMYRPDPNASTFSFAFARELRNSLKGGSAAVANSIDAQGFGNTVPNWMEISNVTTAPESFIHRVYAQDGSLLLEHTVVVPPLGQRDINACHEYGQRVCYNELQPLDGDAPYLAAVSRYSSNHKSGDEAQSYNYAFSVDTRAGSGATQFAPVFNLRSATYVQSSWVEVQNTRGVPVTFRLAFRRANGELISESRPTLQPRSQFHFNASAMLPDNSRGSVEVEGFQPGSLLVQVVTYYHDLSSNSLQTAFSLQARSGGGSKQTGSVNTFLGMHNELLTVRTGSTAVTVSGELKLFDGQTIQSNFDSGESAVQSLGLGQQALGQGSDVPADIYGALTLTTPNAHDIVADILRERTLANGKVDFVMPTTVQ